MTEAFMYAGVGMGIVFLVLILLWLVLEGFQLFFYTLPRRRAARAVSSEEKTSAAPALETPQAGVPDGALIAVLTAAVAAYEARPAEEGLHIVSFRRIR